MVKASLRCALVRRPTVGRFFAISCLCALAWGEHLASAQAPGALELTEDEAVRRALTRPARLEGHRARVRAERARAMEAEAWPNPELSYTRQQLYERPRDLTEDYVQLSQPVPLSGQRGLRAEAARARARARQLEGRAEDLALARQVRQRFYQILWLQERVATREAWLAQLDPLQAQLRRRVDAGEAAPLELARQRHALAGVRADIAEDRAQLAGQRARLAGWVDADLSRELRARGQLSPQTLPNEATLREGVAARPELEAARQRLEAARRRSEAADRWWVPTPTLTGGYWGARSGEEPFHGFIAGVGLTVPLFDRARGERVGAQAELAQARAHLQMTERRLLAEVLGQARQARQLGRAAQRWSRDGLASAQRALELAQRAYRGGELGAGELVEAHRAVVEARLRWLELAHVARASYIELQAYLEPASALRELENE